jgi:Protein of unknown function (DUF3276)
MGERGEVDSATVYTQHGQKTYFINVKENRYSDLFMVLAESLRNEKDTFDRFALNVFEEDVEEFYVQLGKGIELLKELDAQAFVKELPESWILQSKSGKGDRYFRFAINKRMRMLQLVIAERKGEEDEGAFARTVRLDSESIVSVANQYQRMMKRLLARQQVRDTEPIRNPELVARYLKKANISVDEPKPIRRVVVKRRVAVDKEEKC